MQLAAFEKGQVQVGDATTPYLLLGPQTIEEGARYPLVFFLHGAGERGDDNAAQLIHFPERMATQEYRERYPCFLLAPQCPAETRWSWEGEAPGEGALLDSEPRAPMQGALAALQQVLRSQPIDPDRVYLTGLSMGGYATWELAARYPDWFAAALPICGGAHPSFAAPLSGLPLSVWHGATDVIVPAELSRTMVEGLRALGAEPLYAELEGVGHESWHRAYDTDGAMDWLFAQRRDPAAQLAAAARLLAEALAPEERVAFLGDSITQAGNNDGGYVDLLRDVMAEVQPGASVIPAGISGHKVPDLLARYERDVVAHGATLVYIYIGINDVWHSTSGRGTSAEDFESGLHTLIDALQASGADVVLSTPSTIGERRPGENSLDEMLEQYSAISRGVAAEQGLVLCDLRRAFQGQLELQNQDNVERGVLAGDGVHLNPAGNVFVATQAARALRRAVLARE